MNFMFLPIIFLPFHGFEYPETVTYVQYVPVQVYGPRRDPEYIYIAEDYHPYTHGFLPEDGSELWDEQDS